jgi:hypothetical protein
MATKRRRKTVRKPKARPTPTTRRVRPVGEHSRGFYDTPQALEHHSDEHLLAVIADDERSLARTEPTERIVDLEAMRLYHNPATGGDPPDRRLPDGRGVDITSPVKLQRDRARIEAHIRQCKAALRLNRAARKVLALEERDWMRAKRQQRRQGGRGATPSSAHLGG